ncbi:hypothetical protein QC762_307260 [Podospora pseudocomata]|uniref:Uncharacterized protein n=1 Tax=Podospora pseudocomata TaxID=2093779 RepID=A0ABR0GJS5_9PEZI|nr:hypothetical protein QC762_307260 [Podospora pseudocomata]
MTMIAPLFNGISQVILSHKAPSLFLIPFSSFLLTHTKNASTYSNTKLCVSCSRFPPARSYHSATCLALATTPTAAPFLQTLRSTSSASRFPRQKRFFSRTAAVKMSDEDYLAFLNKANASSSTTTQAASSSDKQHFKLVDPGVEVPEKLKQAVEGKVYTAASSEAESPCEVVALRLEGDGGLPDEEEFARMIGHTDPKGAKVEIKDPVDWDPEGGNNEVLEAVREVGKGGDVRVYEVGGDERGVRVCYFLVTAVGGKVLGVVGEGIFT